MTWQKQLRILEQLKKWDMACPSETHLKTTACLGTDLISRS
jgi:hypothetical protein